MELAGLRLALDLEPRLLFLDLLDAYSGARGMAVTVGTRGGAGASLSRGTSPSTSCSSSRNKSASLIKELGALVL